MKNLLIVESPTKARTIQKYLGPDWIVKASWGHVRDLPVETLGIDPDDNYKLTYEISKDKHDTVAQLRAAVKATNDVFLATDPDREGEAIAWHLQTLLRLKNAKRVVFPEITAKLVKAGIAAATSIDYALVGAQEARRAIDRLVGYKVSGALKRKTGQGSAGRVQTIGLRIIVDREEEIAAFVPRDYCTVKLTFANGVGGKPWTAAWDFSGLLLKDETLWTDVPFAERVAALRAVRVIKAVDSIMRTKPPAPFTTSTFTQAASNQLRIGAKAAMKAAQDLYESGLITYMRTDSPNIGDEAYAAIAAYAKVNNLPINPVKRTWPSKDLAQNAHEAIRPTDIRVEDCGKGGALQRVYELIRLRTLASQMLPAVYDVRKLTLESVEKIDGEPMTFIANGRTLRAAERGWRAIVDRDATSEEKADPAASNPVPFHAPGTALTAIDGKATRDETEPKPRYTEASLTKKLEQEGVGRPSTYASIIDLIQTRAYVELIDRAFHPLPLGTTLIHALRSRFAFVEIDFTANLEASLDKIASGQMQYLELVRATDAVLDRELSAFADVTIAQTQVVTDGPCPACGTGLLTKRQRRTAPAAATAPKGRGKAKKAKAPTAAAYFWSCSRRPECPYSCDDVDGKPSRAPQKERIAAVEGGPCTACKTGTWLLRAGQFGRFWSCSRWNARRNKCTATVADDNGKPATFYGCPGCKTGGLRQRTSAKGHFWGCSAYPKCTYNTRDLNGVPDMTVPPPVPPPVPATAQITAPRKTVRRSPNRA